MSEEIEFKKKHLQSHFYKYTHASTAKIVLEKGSFLAKSPLEFNDPFDVQIGMHFGFDISNFHEMLYEKMVELIELNEEPKFENKNEISEFVITLREAHKLGTLNIKKLKSETKTASDVYSGLLEKNRKMFVEAREILVRQMRILCLSTTPNNLLMWSHYAKDHTGVVIKLKVAETEEDDDPLWLAEKVYYTPSALPLMTKAEALDGLFGIKKFQGEKLGRQLALTKFNVWEYENEFRFYDLVGKTNQADYTIGIAPERFEAVYFGVKSDENDVKDIKRIASILNKDIEFYQAKRHKSDYKIEFEKI